jgi:hypothetical protein
MLTPVVSFLQNLTIWKRKGKGGEDRKRERKGGRGGRGEEGKREKTL